MSIRTSTGRTRTRPTSGSSARSQGCWAWARPTSARSTGNLPLGRDVNYPVVTADRHERRRQHPGAAAEPGVRPGADARLGSVLELQRPAAHVQHAPVAQRERQRLLHAQQDHVERAAAQQHDAGRRAELHEARRTNTAAPTPTSGTSSAPASTGRSTTTTAATAFWRGLLNGWRVAPIIKLRSGLPFTHHQRQRRRQPRRPDQRSGAAGRRSRRSTTPRRSAGSIPPRSCRTRSSPARPPTATRRATCSTARGSRSSTWPSRATSSCPARSTLTFRAEATNAFNIVNYGQPGNSVPSGATSTTFGIIRTANAMRRLQLGVRLSF